jgi:hypothetical protein
LRFFIIKDLFFQKGLPFMLLTTPTLLRYHSEAVWGIQLPPLEQKNDVTVLLRDALPAWRLCAAEIAGGRICIWRSDVEEAVRGELLARLDEALLLPSTSTLPPGVSREVAFLLVAEPAIDLAAANRVARLLTPDDYALIETFETGIADAFLQPELGPLSGVAVDGLLFSLAHSSRRTREACELGIETLPEARRKGYALAATIVWSAAVMQEGLTPIYSAFAVNTPSLNLAVAAGYREFARVATVE